MNEPYHGRTPVICFEGTGTGLGILAVPFAEKPHNVNPMDIVDRPTCESFLPLHRVAREANQNWNDAKT